MACVDTDTRIYIWVDTSGTVDEAAIQAAVTQLKARLQATVYGGIDVNTRVFYTSAWTDERWVTKLTQTTQAATNAIALVFLNESGPIYHANSGTSIEPTAAYLADHAVFLSAVAGAESFHGLLYAVAGADPWYPIFKTHAGNALAGENGYPDGLAAYGVSARFDVDPEQDADAYYRDVIAYLDGLCGEPRVRGSLSEDAGSILLASTVVPVESGISEAFFRDIQLDPGALTPYLDTFDSRTLAVYYPQEAHSPEHLREYTGGTKLGRMAHVYPSPIIDTTQNLLGLPRATAQQAIQHIFTGWALEFPWFTFEPIPDLRYPVETGDYSGTAGVLTTEAILIPQAKGERKTMRELVDEWLGIFPGTILRQNSSGNVELVPLYGPDAPADPELLLNEADTLPVTPGVPDRNAIANIGRVESTGYEFQPEQSIAPGAFSLAGTLPDEAFPEPPDPNALPDDRARHDDGALQPFTGLVSGDEIEIEWAGTLYTAERSGDAWAHFSVRGTDGGTLSLTRAVPTRTVKVNGTVYWGYGNVLAHNYSTTWRFTWVVGRGVTLETLAPDGTFVEYLAGSKGRTWYMGHYLEWEAFGTAFVKRNETIIGEFGKGDNLPAPGGGNAITISQTTYGEREIQVRSDVFALTPRQALSIAEALVLHHINPVTRLEVEQSYWGGFPVEPDHIGRIIALPDLSEARVVGERHVVDHTALVLQGSFTALVTTPAVSTDGLLSLDSGALMALDSGELVEVS